MAGEIGVPGGVRSLDPVLKRHVLYQLSYGHRKRRWYYQMATIKPDIIGGDGGIRILNVSSCRILSSVCLAYCTTSPFLIFYKYYNIFYIICQDLMLVLRSTNRTSHSLLCPVGVIFATISTLVIRLRFELRELWVQSPRRYHFATGYHFYKYYNIFYNICQDFYWRKREDSNL